MMVYRQYITEGHRVPNNFNVNLRTFFLKFCYSKVLTDICKLIVLITYSSSFGNLAEFLEQLHKREKTIFREYRVMQGLRDG